MTNRHDRQTSRFLLGPSAHLLGITLGVVFACFVVTLLALRTPWLGLVLEPPDEGPGLEVVEALGPASSIMPGSRLLLVGPATATEDSALGLSSFDLTEDPGMLSSFEDVARFMAHQSRLYQWLASGPVNLVWITPGGVRQATDLQAAPRRPLGSLPWLYWLQLASGLMAAVIGSWVWVLRPHDWGARMFGLSGCMMLAFTLPAAWYSTRELALDGDTFTLLAGINISGAIFFGCALIAIFLCFPRQLIRPVYLWFIPSGFGVLLLAELLQLWSRPWGNLITLVQTLIALACLLIQWRATRQRPAERAALRWVGLSAIVGAALFVVPMGMAWLLQITPPLSQGLGFLFFLIMFGGIALGVARFRLFELDEWAYRILLWITGVVLLLLVDATLLWALHATPALSLGLALLVVGFLYLPLRNWLWQRLVGRPGTTEDTVFRGLLDIVLEPDETRRAQQWQNLLHTLFRPLELEELPESDTPQDVAITDEGQALYLPPTSGSPALLVRYPWQGRGLFNREQLRIARRLLAFLAQADISRAEFARGVSEERQRITRDLHDDIASRLITSLHQTQDPVLQRTLRNTLQDLRIILSGLAGEAMTAQELLLRLESEARERLRAAHIDLQWEAPLELPAIPLSYGTYKNLLSAQREVISNIVRHSKAQNVTIQVNWKAGTLLITTTDFHDLVPAHAEPFAIDPMPTAGHDNSLHTGTAPQSQPGLGINLGMGIANLQQRLTALGGQVTMTRHAQGQQVQLCLPVSQAQTPPYDTTPSEGT